MPSRLRKCRNLQQWRRVLCVGCLAALLGSRCFRKPCLSDHGEVPPGQPHLQAREAHAAVRGPSSCGAAKSRSEALLTGPGSIAVWSSCPELSSRNHFTAVAAKVC